jgi:hypothetical protein
VRPRRPWESRPRDKVARTGRTGDRRRVTRRRHRGCALGSSCRTSGPGRVPRR